MTQARGTNQINCRESKVEGREINPIANKLANQTSNTSPSKLRNMKNPLNHIKTLTDSWEKISLSFLLSELSVSLSASLSPSLKHSTSPAPSHPCVSRLLPVSPPEFNHKEWVSCEIVHDIQCVRTMFAWMPTVSWVCGCVCVCVRVKAMLSSLLAPSG